MIEALDARDVARAFAADRVAANAAYAGRTWTVTGIALSVGEGHGGEPVLTFDGVEGATARVTASFAKDAAKKVAAIEARALVSVLGTLVPYQHGPTIELRDAVLVPPGAASVFAELRQIAALGEALGLGSMFDPPVAAAKTKPAAQKRPAAKTRPAPKKRPRSR